MAYLYLNFQQNLNDGCKRREDFYTLSLNEQYEAIKRKLDNPFSTLQEFISYCFPALQNEVYCISIPAFEREIQESKGWLNNIIIRPEKNNKLRDILSDKYDLIVLGDLLYGSVISVIIKGLELIDASTKKYGERKVLCRVGCAFTCKILSNGYEVPDYGLAGEELRQPILTQDFVSRLCTELYPVPNPEVVIDELEKWEDYLDFRKYYLKKQSEKHVKINEVEVCDSYLTTKTNFKQNRDEFSEILLDGIEQFGKGEQVVLSKKVQNSESFPLIRVSVEKNRKELLSETVYKGGKGKPKFEVDLNRYTKDSMGLSHNFPTYDLWGNIEQGKWFSQYLLGERYLFTYVDVEPDLRELINKYSKLINKENEEIETEYRGVIKQKVEKYINSVSSELEKKHQEELTDFKEELNKNLKKDVEENNDKNVKDQYQSEIEKITKKDKLQISELKKQKIKIFDKIRKSKKNENVKAAETELSEIEGKIKELNQAIERLISQVDLQNFYIKRNEKLIEDKKKSFNIQKQGEIERKRKEKTKELETFYKSKIDEEKIAKKTSLTNELEKLKNEKVENETIRRYLIYFRPDDILEKIKEIKKAIANEEPQFLTYDNRAEKAKIERQDRALESIKLGYVKNPYLASYLFAPECLTQCDDNEEQEINWCLEGLNDRQQLAVRKALNSESIFLLQGPPGTGKTQVIAELTAQYTKQGKKVLISSETHKAIDNVFERLPKIPEIRPLRLIPSQNGKETNYSPENLVDNFYKNIRGNLERQIRLFENFEETKDNFDKNIKELRKKYDDLLKLEDQNNSIKQDIHIHQLKVENIRKKIENLNSEKNIEAEKKDKMLRTIKHIENNDFNSFDADYGNVLAYKEKAQDLLKQADCFKEFDVEKLKELMSIDINEISNEVYFILSKEDIVKREVRKREISQILAHLRYSNHDLPPVEGDESYFRYIELQNEFIELEKKAKKYSSSSEFDINETKISEYFPYVLNNKLLLNSLVDEIKLFRLKLQRLIQDETESLILKVNQIDDRCIKISSEITRCKSELSREKQSIEQLREDEGVKKYEELNTALKQEITEFFHDFNIIREYTDIEMAFDIMNEEWNRLRVNFKKDQVENELKIPVYKEICEYLSQEEILEEDRRNYTRDLFDCANVFGITCTSRDKFTAKHLSSLNKYGIESIDIKKEGIDVVIIDEVSKSSFLDLLIPILYGKTVILCGDHRQLPPMYDLKYLREDDFEDLDESIISSSINEEYTELYEKCFFKSLYENINEDFRVMLNKQYRCHSHIMEVFNHFYGGNKTGLTIGFANQDDQKQHNLLVNIGGQTIIDPSHHVYFIDCEKKESSAYEGSTSKINEQEAEVAMKLLFELDNASCKLLETNKIKYDLDKGIDQRPSIGVICTYGDQARLIKKKRKYKQFKGFSGKEDEKLIISTVDDFQGDERDIIIVSMVRNPQGRKFDTSFIKKFERINVALSRARKLLIVLGSKEFLAKNSFIDLPDLNGRKELDKKNYPVFQEIIDTIAIRGSVIPASDIIGDEE